MGVRYSQALVVVPLLLVLTTCANPETSETRPRDFFDSLLSPNSNVPQHTEEAIPESRIDPQGERQPTNRNSYIVEGSDGRSLGGFEEADLEGDSGEEYSFRFVDAPVEDVIEAVLGQALGVPYTIAPGVSGRLSLSTSEPVSQSVVLTTLADILSLSGIALVQVGNVYRLQPSNAPTSDVARRLGSLAGAATEIVPLNYVQGAEIAQALESMSGLNVVVRPIPGRNNVITLTGSRQDILQALDLIDAFDTNALEGMSFGLFYLERADVADVVEELEQIFGVQGGGLRFIAVERLNGFFAFAPEVETLQEVRRWQRRLDQVVSSASPKVFVQSVRHRRSGEMVDILNSLYRGGSASSDRTAALGGTAERVSTSSRIVDDEANNAILFYGTAAEFDLVKTTIDRLDVLPHQVLIEAAVVEVSLDDDLRYGVQWLFEKGDFQARLSNATTGAIAGTFPGFAATVEASNINAVLSALDSVTNINVVSSPRMLVESGKTAALQVGDEVPIATQTSTSNDAADARTINTIQYRDTGVILEVTPQVNEGGFVKLHIVQEISDVTTTVTSDLDSPTIQQRRFESYVSVEDGSTIALGGLIRERSELQRSGVPLANEIPILGNLFSTTSDVFDRSELLVLLTPRVVRTSEDMTNLTNELKADMRAAFGEEN